MRSKLGQGLFLLGAVLMFVGIAREEALIVLDKAITICLQCIGIG